MDLWNFIKERFPIRVSLPLVVIICTAPLSHIKISIVNIVLVNITIFLGLLCLRIVDDVMSIDVDRVMHPDRGLPSGKIRLSNLRSFMTVIVLIILIINYFWGQFSGIAIMTIYYGLFFKFKYKIPLLIRPFFSNMIFFGIPGYVYYVESSQISYVHMLLGLFIWLTVVAHEFAHSVHGDKENTQLGILTYSKILGARGSALLSLLFFFMASIVGFIFWFNANKPKLFFIMLLITGFHIGYLEFNLIKEPVQKKANPFYIYGFTFFLLPCMGLIIDSLG